MGLWTPLLCTNVPKEVLFSVFPFKVEFHVQTAMHAIAKYCSSVSKTKQLCGEIIVTFVVLVLRFSLAYFSLCDFSRVVISPPAISPPVSMVKPIVDSIHVYEHIDDALSLSCDSPPLLMTCGLSLQPRWEDGLCTLFLCFELCACLGVWV